MFRRPIYGDLGGGGENWRKGVKKGRQLRRCLTERSTDVSFPKKGRQIFASPQSVPPNFRDKSPPLAMTLRLLKIPISGLLSTCRAICAAFHCIPSDDVVIVINVDCVLSGRATAIVSL
jgi:hypothetical protein